MGRLSIPALGMLAVLAVALVIGCSGAPASAPLRDLGNSADTSDVDPFAGAPGSEDETNQAPGDAPADGALIVHTGSMSLEVSDLRTTIDQATALVSGLGGSVAASHEQNSGGRQNATVTYRIPAQRWTEALTGLRALGQRVLSEDTDAEDVTAEVIDLDARIANLQTSEAALQGIMGRATTIADVLKVQGELTSVRGDIESMIAKRDHLADQAALGTLEVTYSVPVDEAAAATSGWDLGREVDGALAALVRVGQGLASVTVWLMIVVLPVLIPVALIAYIGFRVRRRYLSRQAAQQTPSV